MCSPSPFSFSVSASPPTTPPPLYLPLSCLPHSSSLLSPPFSLLSPLSKKPDFTFLFPAQFLRQFRCTRIHENNKKIASVNKSAHDLYLLFSSFTGEGEEVHAPSGQPEGPRCGEEFHVQQAHILYFQHGVEVSPEIVTFSFLLFMWLQIKQDF